MPIRIYTLAKELKIDNKILVDICTKAGITGKGSALASLTDEETAKLKAYMNAHRASRGGAAVAGSREAGAQATVLRREDYIAPAGIHGGKIPVLPGKTEKPPLLKKKPGEKAWEEKPAEEKPAATEETEESKAQKLKKAGKKPAETPPLTPAEIKEAAAKVADEAAQPAKPTETEKEKKDREKDRDRGVRGIKLAPLPTISKTPGKAKRKEPAPQKPDLKLPKDAIRAGKAGGKPLSEHLRKAEQKRRASVRRGIGQTSS